MKLLSGSLSAHLLGMYCYKYTVACKVTDHLRQEERNCKRETAIITKQITPH